MLQNSRNEVVWAYTRPGRPMQLFKLMGLIVNALVGY